jgi:hypothetical protein
VGQFWTPIWLIDGSLLHADSHDVLKESFYAFNGMILLLQENSPVLFTPSDLGLQMHDEYYGAPSIPVVVIMDESSAPDLRQVCASVISSISEVKVYKQTLVIYHRLSQPLATITFEDYEKTIDPIGYILAHSNIVAQYTQGLEKMKINSTPSSFWIREISNDRHCYIYQCVFSRS